MKQCVRISLALSLCMVLMPVMNRAMAQEGGDDAGASEDANQVTQAELAQMLVNIMGLSPFVSMPATPFDLFKILVANGVVPADGWIADAVVTKADLARVLTQAMGSAGEIENPDDPGSWVSYLEETGVEMDTVGEAVVGIAPKAMVDPVISYAAKDATSWDPLKKRTVFGKPDEGQFGTDVALVPQPLTEEEVQEIIAAIPVVAPADRPTPDGGEA